MNIRSGVFYVIPERQMREYARMLWEPTRLGFLHKVRYNVLAAHLHNPPSPEPGRVLFADKAVLVIYDYDNNLGYQIEADFPAPKRVEITPLKGQPDCFSEAEYRDAVQVLASDTKYGEPLRRGIAYCSPGMPPVITEAAPERVWGYIVPFPIYVPDHCIVSVLLHFRAGSGREAEIRHFLIDMTDGRVSAYGTGGSDFYPAACGGLPASGGCTNGGGTAWQVLAWPASNPVWSMLVFKCTGTDSGNGLRFANPGTRAATICDDNDDSGNFRGVGIHEDTDGELLLIIECTAGWYRYITGWRFNQSGVGIGRGAGGRVGRVGGAVGVGCGGLFGMGCGACGAGYWVRA